MASISGRMPPVVIEYDCRGQRKEKYFADAYEARRFYVAKFKKNKSPKVKGTQTMTKLHPIESLAELFTLANDNSAYEKLLRDASRNLGGPAYDAPLAQHKRQLNNMAMETTEEGVVDEINFVIE